MYDRNGLQLSPVHESLNSYRLTAVDLKHNKYTAYAAGTRRNQNEWNMFKIGQYNDPRDAAFIAQEFEKAYDRQTIRQMVTDGVFTEIAKKFRETIEIPEWQYPAEGLIIEDIKNDYGYKMNRVENEKDALREAISVFGLKPPSINKIPALIEKVKTFYSEGKTYREAAKMALSN